MLSAEQFRNIRDKDLEKLPPKLADDLTTWNIGHEHRGVGREFHTEQDILEYTDLWHKWETTPRTIELDLDALNDSYAVTRHALRNLPFPDDHPYHEGRPLGVDCYTTEDYMFINSTLRPADKKIQKVLDFGSGMGRAGNIWSQRVKDLVYCSIDAIELSYIVQNYFYSNHPHMKLFEYFEDPENFEVTEETGIYHLPTWRMELLPDNHFDLVTANMVFPEVTENCLEFICKELTRTLKPGGALYIRDHGLDSFYKHKVKERDMLKDLGFMLEYEPYIFDRRDILGHPRIWRKLEEETPQFYTLDFA